MELLRCAREVFYEYAGRNDFGDLADPRARIQTTGHHITLHAGVRRSVVIPKDDSTSLLPGYDVAFARSTAWRRTARSFPTRQCRIAQDPMQGVRPLTVEARREGCIRGVARDQCGLISVMSTAFGSCNKAGT